MNAERTSISIAKEKLPLIHMAAMVRGISVTEAANEAIDSYVSSFGDIQRKLTERMQPNKRASRKLAA